MSQPLYAGVHRHLAGNYQAASHAPLGKFATDSHYDQKLNQLIQTYHLDQYDQAAKRDGSHHPPGVPQHLAGGGRQAEVSGDVNKPALSRPLGKWLGLGRYLAVVPQWGFGRSYAGVSGK